MATDRRLPVREVDPSQRHLAVESIGAPAGRYIPAVADALSARAVPIVIGTGGRRRRMVIDNLSGNVTFDWPGIGGVAALTATATLSGSSRTQALRLLGNDATLTTWPAAIGGVTGTVTGTPLVNRPCHWSASDRYVQSNGYSVYNFGDVFDPISSDTVLEAIVLVASGTAEIVNKWSTGGLRLYSQSNTIGWRCTAADGTPSPLATISGDFQRQWMHILATLKMGASGGVALYCNAALSANFAQSWGADTVETAAALVIGGGANYGTGVAYLGMWQGAGMLDSYLQPTFAAQRFAAFLGLEAAVGAAKFPATLTRATPAAVPWSPAAGQKSYAFVGPHWIGRTRVRDAGGTERAGIALTCEQTNSFVNSVDISASGWTAIRLSSRAVAGTVEGPIAGSNPNQIKADTANDTHGLSYNVASSTAGQHFLACLYRAGAKSWIKLKSTGAAASYQYYNCTGAGALGTSGSDVDSATIERVYDSTGNAWHLCRMEYTGTAAAHDHDILFCDGDGVDTWTGGGSGGAVVGWIAVPSHQVNQPWYAAPVPTGAAGVTRAVDDLQYAAAGNVDATKGTLKIRSMDDAIIAQAITRRVIEMAADASNGTRISRSTLDAPVAQWETGAAVQAELTTAASGTAADLVSREAEITWASNRFVAAFDGTPAAGSPDTSGTPPALTTIRLGASLAGTAGMGGIIESIEIKDR